MCRHNEEEDFDCVDCCYERGKEDALDCEPKDCQYKNFDQCEAYHTGYSDGEKERQEEENLTPDSV